MHSIVESQFDRFLRDARRAARAIPGTEICGLLVDTGAHLSFVPTRNVSRRVGSFVFSRTDIRRIAGAVKRLGHEIVGTFHSHPGGEPIPGESDIRHAVNDSLMFIFDCIGRDGRLWRIRKGRAYSLRFVLAKEPEPPNQVAGGNAAERRSSARSNGSSLAALPGMPQLYR
jgi:proteasome lid subunit RPN8/RPN11